MAVWKRAVFAESRTVKAYPIPMRLYIDNN